MHQLSLTKKKLSTKYSKPKPKPKPKKVTYNKLKSKSSIYNCLKKIRVYSVALRKPINLVKDITTHVRVRKGRKITLITGKDKNNNVGWKIIANEKA
jgi:hypothetical protein